MIFPTRAMAKLCILHAFSIPIKRVHFHYFDYSLTAPSQLTLSAGI